MNRKQMVVVFFALAACIFLFGLPIKTQAQDKYSFFSHKGAVWQYEVSWSSGEKNVLTVVNEGNTVGTDPGLMTSSWTFKTAIGVSMRMELFYRRAHDGIFLTRVDTYGRGGSHLVLSQRYDPPVLTLKLPLRIGSWEHRGLRVSDKGRESYEVANTARKVSITIPAGTFDAFEIQGRESTGSQSTEYWVENMGLVGMIGRHASGNIMTAKLVGFWPLGNALPVGTKVFLHRPVWGCTTAEVLGEVYQHQVKTSYSQEATSKLGYIAQQRQCIQISDLKGYIVHRKGDAVAINHLEINNRDILLWVPIWSLTPCFGVVCR